MPNKDGKGPIWACLNTQTAQENELDLKKQDTNQILGMGRGQGMGRGHGRIS